MSEHKRAQPVYFKAYLSDPFARFVIDRLRLTPLLLVLIMLGITALVDVVSYRLSPATFWESLERSGWVSAPGNWRDLLGYGVYIYFVGPLVFGVYIWISKAAADLFYKLRDSEALVAPREAYDAFIHGEGTSLERVHNHRGWTIASAVVALALAVGYSAMACDWPPAPRWVRIVKVVFGYLPAWYAICQIVAREAATTWGLRQIFTRFEIYPNPLHPDRAGGLRPIQDYALRFSYFIALAGIGVGLLGFVEWNVTAALSARMIILIILYLVLAVVFFFLPLWSAHEAMAGAKRRLLADISRRFQEGYTRAWADLKEESAGLQPALEKVQDIHSLYQLTDEFPVWPFDVNTLRRFAATVTAPLVPLALDILWNFVKSLVL